MNSEWKNKKMFLQNFLFYTVWIIFVKENLFLNLNKIEDFLSYLHLITFNYFFIFSFQLLMCSFVIFSNFIIKKYLITLYILFCDFQSNIIYSIFDSKIIFLLLIQKLYFQLLIPTLLLKIKFAIFSSKKFRSNL